MHVLGTAGHVDHGKSTLVQALTGIDPDRLAEEKARGLTIDLGFAWLTTPGGREVGIVDVPGHERFVHNMLAGVGSIDATIFVVDAAEGWKPQSEEHLQILNLLGAHGGVVALTKADLVDDDTIDLAREEVAERIAGTALDGAEIVPVSARALTGLPELLAAIDRLLDRTPDPADHDRPRVFVDRSFSIKGAGTVVTGTLTGGTLRADDDVEIAPSGVRARIRGIQTHHRDRTLAEPVARVALNLAGLDRHQIVRGDAVVRPGQWRATHALGVRLRAVRSLPQPITGRGSFKVYVGAAEIGAKLTLLDVPRVGAGGEAYARLLLDEPIVATEGDRFVLRDTGRRETVAGGVILDAHPVPGRFTRGRLVDRLAARAAAEDVAPLVVAERGVIPADDVVALTGTKEPRGAVRLRSYAADPGWLDRTLSRIEAILRDFHEAEPLARGMPRDDARRAASIPDARLFLEILEQAPERVALEGALLHLVSHAVRLTPEQEAARAKLMDAASGFAPPSLAELQRSHGGKLVGALIDSADLVKLSPQMVFSRTALEDAKRIMSEAVASEGPLTASRIRELLGTSRKYVIPLLEYLDATGFTRRDGDVRTVR